MSHTEEDARWDELWDQMSKELYPEHKEHAIDEFIKERLQSFYLKNPTILTPVLHHIVNPMLLGMGFEKRPNKYGKISVDMQKLYNHWLAIWISCKTRWYAEMTESLGMPLLRS